MAILYVASEAAELKPFAQKITGLRELKWPLDYAWEGVWKGQRQLLVANGMGPTLAGRAVEIAIRAVTSADLSASKLEAVVSVGYCGALDPRLHDGAIIVADEVLETDTGERFGCATVDSDQDFVRGRIITQNRIAINSLEKQALLRFEAIALDMEASGVATKAKRAGLPFICIKVVSDRADESFRLNLNDMRDVDGRIMRGKIALYAARHPKLVPELLKLKRRAKGAAMCLGEFLVSCGIKSGDELREDSCNS